LLLKLPNQYTNDKVYLQIFCALQAIVIYNREICHEVQFDCGCIRLESHKIALSPADLIAFLPEKKFNFSFPPSG